MAERGHAFFHWRRLAWLLVPYAIALWWVHHRVRDPFNVDYLRRYISARCSARLLDARSHPTPVEKLVEIETGLRRCQGMSVEIDGVWGGLMGSASVRLRIRTDGDPGPLFKYYSVEITPLLGTISIRHELDPWMYFLNV